ncbi:MAG: lysophospholipid acyltransferase family protein [Verrucomicrobiales bacterium]|nr:lysophospholipid acyltransferase family protein [Verrucomicrobiales bacterium]
MIQQGTVEDSTGYNAPETDVITKRSPLLYNLLAWAFARQLKKNFHAVNLLTPPPAVDGPLICFMNHPSWNDPMVMCFLSQLFFPDRELYGPMDADALKGYPMFARAGCYPVTHGNAGGARKFLRTSRAILQRPQTVIWINPQGRFADARERPVTFEPGLGALLKTAKTPVTTLPVALEYTYGVEQCPEVFVTFGEAVQAPDGDWTSACEKAMQTTQDHLAERVIARKAGEFTTILGGSVGVGGVYELWQRCRAVLRGETYHPGHSSLTK